MLSSLQYQKTFQKSRLLSNIADWFMLALCLGLFVFAIKSPIQNWDMLGYAASVVTIENTDKDYIHKYVYQQYKAYATPEEFKELTETSSYRKTMSQNAEAFNQQIPFYKIRIILVLLVFFLVKLGVNIFVASHLITAAFTCLGILVFYDAFRKRILPAFWIVIPIFLVGFGIVDVARMVTADSIAFLWVALICYTFLNSKWKTFFLLLATSVLIRTDMIFLIGLFSGYFILFRPELRLIAITTLLASIGIYLSINSYANNYGWSTVFYYAVISDMEATHPLEYSSIGVSIEQYLSAVKSNLAKFFPSRAISLFAIAIFLQVTIFAASLRRKLSFALVFRGILNHPILLLTTISILYIIIHYILFPLLFERFFIGYYMIGALGFLATVTDLTNGIISQEEIEPNK